MIDDFTRSLCSHSRLDLHNFPFIFKGGDPPIQMMVTTSTKKLQFHSEVHIVTIAYVSVQKLFMHQEIQ